MQKVTLQSQLRFITGALNHLETDAGFAAMIFEQRLRQQRTALRSKLTFQDLGATFIRELLALLVSERPFGVARACAVVTVVTMRWSRRALSRRALTRCLDQGTRNLHQSLRSEQRGPSLRKRKACSDLLAHQGIFSPPFV